MNEPLVYKNMEYIGFVGIMEQKIETTILGFRD